jgi:hypothetical protein
VRSTLGGQNHERREDSSGKSHSINAQSRKQSMILLKLGATLQYVLIPSANAMASSRSVALNRTFQS